jgi:hypothetical protein
MGLHGQRPYKGEGPDGSCRPGVSGRSSMHTEGANVRTLAFPTVCRDGVFPIVQGRGGVARVGWTTSGRSAIGRGGGQARPRWDMKGRGRTVEILTCRALARSYCYLFIPAQCILRKKRSDCTWPQPKIAQEQGGADKISKASSISIGQDFNGCAKLLRDINQITERVI